MTHRSASKKWGRTSKKWGRTSIPWPVRSQGELPQLAAGLRRTCGSSPCERIKRVRV